MSKETESWHSERLQDELKLVRWGHVGTPVLIIPTAGGDAEECERFLMLNALAPLFDAGRVKVYSLDSLGTQALLDEENSREHAAWVQSQFLDALRHEVVPAIRSDCKSDEIEVVLTGSSLGAFNALAAICRYPDVFSHAICMSGTYDLSRWLEDRVPGAWRHTSPMHYLPALAEGPHLEALRKRFVLLTHGTGRWEAPRETWEVADLLGSKGIPNRVDEWGDEWDHDWPTWRNMLPRYLDELLPAGNLQGAGEA